MAIDKLNPKLIGTTGASDGDALVYRSTNGQIEFGSVSVDTSSITTGLTGANSNITALDAELDQLGSYANSTFATATNLNTVSSNAATNASSITALDAELNTFGSYANSTFATDTNLNTVSSNAATNASSITALNAELDSFGSYANATFGSAGIVVENQGTVKDGATANINFGAGLSVTTSSSNTVTVVATQPTYAYFYSSQVFVASGSANTFTMSVSVANATNMFVAIDGLLQTPEDDYFVSGTTLTIANVSPLVANTEIEARYILSETSTANLVNDIFTATGTSNTFTMSQTPVNKNSIMVVFGGVLQSPAAPSNNYITSGTSLILNNTAPIANNTIISVRHLPGLV